MHSPITRIRPPVPETQEVVNRFLAAGGTLTDPHPFGEISRNDEELLSDFYSSQNQHCATVFSSCVNGNFQPLTDIVSGLKNILIQ